MLSNDIKSYLDTYYEEMLKLLERLVNIDSGSACKEGIDRVASIMAREYEKEGFEVEILEHGNCGNAVIARKSGTDPEYDGSQSPKTGNSRNHGKVLMFCHLDTAFPEGAAKANPFTIKGNIATGPGVVDMKACLVGCLYALKALYALGVDHVPEVTVLMSGDEEAGSHAVQERIIEEGRKADWCIVTEGARENGAIVIERKGNSYFHVRASGRAAHAGIEPEKGRNAIEELALKIVKLRALNDFDRGSTVTIGTINGGENRIVVAESAEMDIDLRYRTKEDGEMLIRQVRDILEQAEIHGVRTEYTFTRNRPPLVQVEGSAQLQRLVEEASQELGIPYLTAVTGGVSDGNFVADIGTPTIDGLGPVGGMMCSPEEYLCLDSMTERIARMGTVVGWLGCLADVGRS